MSGRATLRIEMESATGKRSVPADVDVTIPK
jgi:hypothetical protein